MINKISFQKKVLLLSNIKIIIKFKDNKCITYFKITSYNIFSSISIIKSGLKNFAKF